eukprot:CAMPEP_0168421426 /NCGR_PEP_ID=MMETSP0228-20121227/33275_1 /TAXON_ID=133427 /ORGANISM="Protoceratium reticulatum, Strain CCCM 535 (=CCMP 1889)" /LENGTH=107 /DNA_ID=CAMNT_0008435333 /DNA_START=138 /DNA_END=458 /DNA_ORIENTATION=+
MRGAGPPVRTGAQRRTVAAPWPWQLGCQLCSPGCASVLQAAFATAIAALAHRRLQLWLAPARTQAAQRPVHGPGARTWLAARQHAWGKEEEPPWHGTPAAAEALHPP